MKQKILQIDIDIIFSYWINMDQKISVDESRSQRNIKIKMKNSLVFVLGRVMLSILFLVHGIAVLASYSEVFTQPYAEILSNSNGYFKMEVNVAAKTAYYLTLKSSLFFIK